MTEPVHHEFTIERRLAAPRELVFRTFSEQELKAKWFRHPDPAAKAEHELDFRIGGREVARTQAPGAPVHTFDARYYDIVDGERTVFAYDMLLGDHRMSVSLTTIQLTSDGDVTTVTFTEQGVFFDGIAEAQSREHGSGLLLDQFAAFVESAVAA